MIFKFLFAILFLHLSICAIGQHLHIQGSVKEKSSNHPIAFANIYINGTSAGTITNQDDVYLFHFSEK